MTLSTFSVCRQTTEQLCPPALSGCFFTTASVFANIQITFHPALRQDTGGKYTYGEHKYRSADSQAPGSASPLTQYLSVTGIRDAPALQVAWLRVAGVAAENNYPCLSIGGHLQRRFPIPTAAVTGRRRRRMQNTPSPLKPANQRASERAVNSPASSSADSLKDSRAVICKSPAKCSAQHFPLRAEWHYTSIIETI